MGVSHCDPYVVFRARTQARAFPFLLLFGGSLGVGVDLGCGGTDCLSKELFCEHRRVGM